MFAVIKVVVNHHPHLIAHAHEFVGIIGGSE